MMEGNPALRHGIKAACADGSVFSWTGTSVKMIVLLVALLLAFGWAFQKTTTALPTHTQLAEKATVDEKGETKVPVALLPQEMTGIFWLSLLGGFTLAMFVIVVPQLAPYFSIVYAVLEGVVLGAVTACFEVNYPNIGFQAGALTLGCVLVMWFLYTTRILKATPKFACGLITAMGAILLAYITSLLMEIFTGQPLPYIHDGGVIGILISVAIVIVASLNLIIDFDLIDTCERKNSPKYMEWYCAFGVIVTLVWLYLEVLRLLAKLRGNGGK